MLMTAHLVCFREELHVGHCLANAIEITAQEGLEQAASKLNVPREKIQNIVARGIGSQEIIRIASENKADLIVMGTHGYTGLTHALLGSTAERVVRRAACPVLTVKGKEKVED